MESLREWLRPELIWFVVGLVLLLLELGVPGLVLFFFGMGAWVVTLVCFAADIALETQLIIFIVASVLLLVLLRRRLKSLFFGPGSRFENIADLEDEYTGKKVKVIEEITPDNPGKVEFHGSVWEAVGDVVIPAGSMVEITAKDSIKLKVKPL